MNRPKLSRDPIENDQFERSSTALYIYISPSIYSRTPLRFFSLPIDTSRHIVTWSEHANRYLPICSNKQIKIDRVQDGRVFKHEVCSDCYNLAVEYHWVAGAKD